MRPRADVRRQFHHVLLALTLHAAQRANERRERPAFRWADAIEIARLVVPRLCRARRAREVPQESPCRDAVLMMLVLMLMLMLLAVGRGYVDVHMFSARGERAQIIGKVFERARFVGAKHAHDVLEARRRAIPLFFGGVFARAVEEHAEAARRVAILLYGGSCRSFRIYVWKGAGAGRGGL